MAFGMTWEKRPERAHLDAVRLQEMHSLGLQHAPPLCISPVCMAVRLCLECAQILLQLLAAERALAVLNLQHVLSLQIHACGSRSAEIQIRSLLAGHVTCKISRGADEMCLFVIYDCATVLSRAWGSG